MSDGQTKFRVVVIQDDGERVIVTAHTTQERAEHVARIIREDGMFAEVIVEPDVSA